MNTGERLNQPDAASGRVAVYFGVRYLTPLMVLIAVAAGVQRPNIRFLTALLTAQVAIALATHALAARGGAAVGISLWIAMVLNVTAISALVAQTGGAGGPLTFLYTVDALAAGILLSSRAGVRMLILSTLAIVALDVVMRQPASGTATFLPRGLETVAALWIIGGAGTLFSVYNERELRRRNAELGTIRQVTLDIEDTLTLEEIFGDLSRGVVEAFGFEGAAVLLREGDTMRCAAAHGVTGALGAQLDLRGRLASALALAQPLVTARAEAITDGALIPLIGNRGYVAVPIAEDGLLIATRAGRRRRPGTVRSHEIEALDRLAHHARLAIANARLHARVSEMATTDPLTGLANHGEMQRRLAFETGRLQRFATLRGAGHRLSFLLLDIDNFKRFNDRYGHQAGDEVLKGVAAAVRTAVRTFDVVARYGGEELAVILPETGVEAAREVAERVRRSVAAYPFPSYNGGKPVRVTISIGIATAPDSGQAPTLLVKQADAALYRAKDEGRNRVRHASDVPMPIARVLAMDPTRPRRGQDGARARAGSRRARARSSLPRPRTPRA
jgi:diguanylate cyclase (GGDEF)-like protein